MNPQQKKPFIGSLVEGSLDTRVYQDILRAHAKEAISFPGFGNLSITNVDPKTISRAQLTECEISPFRQQEFVCSTGDPPPFIRKPSTPKFSAQNVAWQDLQALLIHSFSPDKAGHRPYPSAGGLYPVEPLVFIFNERLCNQPPLKSGCYHYRTVSQSLQLIKALPMAFFFEKILHGFIDLNHAPAFCIAYVAHAGKTIFKYRYRGYRHALMEAGSMYQHAGHIAQNMDLRNTVWSTFSDHELLYELGLDHGTYLALTMQLFGYGESS
ncbi:SagB/ThcOx family dehydrogenase [Legionella londiniensis]|uniref:Uncharacterized protein n=1 Tax=Legionella londiniensis TaxID=45068 RepID=A0A0W0VHG1_9GAMM|nr:SagB/ThcOx family dehydrogenase [Legionella londiniensis]KTD19554.1 hypothetical protein Llon_2134 [Legionella londiniensis]STX92224.1 SagB-type dehydrogenase domain [Legionella londiniensis]